MRLKHDVDPSALRPELLLAIVIAMRIYDELDYECEVTSLRDGKHSLTSLHYAGAAVDLGTKDLPFGEAEKITGQLRTSLTRDYGVILENDHTHIEYQPRRKP